MPTLLLFVKATNVNPFLWTIHKMLHLKSMEWQNNVLSSCAVHAHGMIPNDHWFFGAVVQPVVQGLLRRLMASSMQLFSFSNCFILVRVMLNPRDTWSEVGIHPGDDTPSCTHTSRQFSVASLPTSTFLGGGRRKLGEHVKIHIVSKLKSGLNWF